MEWFDAIGLVRGELFRITTPSGTGTGFLLFQSQGGGFTSIATAAHVISHAHEWEQPIRITHHASGQSLLLRSTDRAVNLRTDSDTAAISFRVGAMNLADKPLPLIQHGYNVKPGVEIGWVGFPGIFPNRDCFFSGRVSHWIDSDRAYLVDGVVIHGVSGSPAFMLGPDHIEVIGVVTNYYANRQTGDSLPGLGAIRDVRHFQEFLAGLPSFEEVQQNETPNDPATRDDQGEMADPITERRENDG